MSTPQSESTSGHGLLLMLIAFFGIFVYGLLAALPGTVLATLERNQYLPSDSAVGTFLLLNGLGAVLAYLVSGPIIDRVGKKFALAFGAAMVIVALTGFALIVSRLGAGAALLFLFACSLVLGLGANAIVASGHALVADVASNWRNAALNILDIFFGLGLAALPLVVQAIQQRGGLALVFWALAGATGVLLVLVAAPRFPKPAHPESITFGEAGELFRNPSFWLLAIALFMYVGAEVSVVKWVVGFMERDPRILIGHGLSVIQVQQLAHSSPDMLNSFYERDVVGKGIATYALTTISIFAGALLVGRLVSSFLLGVLRVNSFLLLAIGSVITSLALVISFTASTPSLVRLGVMAAGLGMGPIFPTSVGLASVMAPRIAGTAMSLVMGIGFAGLLVIPSGVGYLSAAVGGAAGDVRTGLLVVVAASVLMLLLHLVLAYRESRAASAN